MVIPVLERRLDVVKVVIRIRIWNRPNACLNNRNQNNESLLLAMLQKAFMRICYMSRFLTRFVTKFGSCFENWQSSIPLRKGKQLQLDKQNRFDFCERALANLSSSLLPISVFKGTMMDAVNYQWSPFSSTGKIYRVVQKKGTVFLSTSQSWPAVAGCSKAETFSQLSSISFAQPCMCFCRDGARYEVHIHQLVTWLRVTKCKVYGLYFIDTTAKEIQQDT